MRAHRGFTLIELLIAMAVLVIASTLAVPAFITFIQNNRLASQTNELVGAFQYARSEALKRGVPVTLCSSSNSDSCSGNFDEGWIVVANEALASREILRIWDAPLRDIEFAPDSGQLVFQPSGFVQGGGSLDLQMAISGCPNGEETFVRIESTGRVAGERRDC